MNNERDRRQSFINSLFEDEDFVRSLFDESGEKGGLELCYCPGGDYRGLGWIHKKITKGGEK